MNIWKLSMSSTYFSTQDIQTMRQQKYVCLDPKTSGKGTSTTSQGDNFIKAKVGDLFYLCISNERIDSIGVFSDDLPFDSDLPGHEGWINRNYEILFEAKAPTSYNKELDKWWTPRNNSTFIQIPKDSHAEFEEHFLKRAFEIDFADLQNKATAYQESFSIKDLLALQDRIYRLENDRAYLYAELNNLPKSCVKKLQYSLSRKGDGPVIKLRLKIAARLLNGSEDLTAEDFQAYKTEIARGYDRNVYKVYTRDFSVLYPFFYNEQRPWVAATLQRLADSLQSDLGLTECTKTKIVDFDGPRFQGLTSPWIAIYNASHKDQSHAYQLFLQIYEQSRIKYGLYHPDTKDEKDLADADFFSYENVVIKMKQYSAIIKGDKTDDHSHLYDYLDLLKKSKNLILTGAPGTGKTYLAFRIAEQLTGKKEDNSQIAFVQFHPSYDYSDFVEGLKPSDLAGGVLKFEVRDGAFRSFCKRAAADIENNYVFIIDEINRADLSRVFGELFFGLEPDYRGSNITTQYAYLRKGEDASFTIPENVYLMGTMNDIDRSVESIDFALRRRFTWKVVSAEESKHIIQESGLPESLVNQAISRMDSLNKAIRSILGTEAYQIGGAYFRKIENYDESENPFSDLWSYHLENLLSEYLRGDSCADEKMLKLKEAYGPI